MGRKAPVVTGVELRLRSALSQEGLDLRFLQTSHLGLSFDVPSSESRSPSTETSDALPPSPPSYG